MGEHFEHCHFDVATVGGAKVVRVETNPQEFPDAVVGRQDPALRDEGTAAKYFLKYAININKVYLNLPTGSTLKTEMSL